jgi:predicted nucleotidyltransferase
MQLVQSKSRTEDAEPVRNELFPRVLSETIALTQQNDAPYLVAGSLASRTWGRPGTLGDIDLLIDPRSAKPLLKAFGEAGFETEETFPQWLFKAKKEGITVDLIFEMAGPLYMEPQMIERASTVEILGTEVRVMSPEDFILSQAMALKEDTAVYWFNALAVIARAKLDWEYLIEMARRGPRRVLSLLLLAQAEDLDVPDFVIRRIFATAFPDQP